MCGTAYSSFSFQSSNTLNNTGVWSFIELAILYTVLSAVNGLSSLTTTSSGQARPIRKFANRPITFGSNRKGRFKFDLNLDALQVPNHIVLLCLANGPSCSRSGLVAQVCPSFCLSVCPCVSLCLCTCVCLSVLYYGHYGWWRGVAATRCVESTKLLYGGPG